MENEECVDYALYLVFVSSFLAYCGSFAICGEVCYTIIYFVLLEFLSFLFLYPWAEWSRIEVLVQQRLGYTWNSSNGMLFPWKSTQICQTMRSKHLNVHRLHVASFTGESYHFLSFSVARVKILWMSLMINLVLVGPCFHWTKSSSYLTYLACKRMKLVCCWFSSSSLSFGSWLTQHWMMKGCFSLRRWSLGGLSNLKIWKLIMSPAFLKGRGKNIMRDWELLILSLPSSYWGSSYKIK